MAAQEVLARCEDRLQRLQSESEQVRQRRGTATIILLAATAIFLALGILALQRRVAAWLPALPIPIAAVSALHYRHLSRDRSRLRRLQLFYQRAVGRVKGHWRGEGSTGDEFDNAGHVDSHDLGIFGDGSLFELLCIARTAIGRRGLANYLLKAPAISETLARQEAIRELRSRADLREAVALLGDFDFSDTKWETFAEWLDSPPVSFSKPLAAIAAVTSALILTILLAAVAAVVTWSHAVVWALPPLLFNSAVGLAYRERVKRMTESLRSAFTEIRVLREGLQLLESQRFSAGKLNQIMTLVDSLLNGRSKFLAEVDRVRQTIQLAENGSAVLFLIDEIFSGTNSRDRRLAAEAVIRTLLNRGALGAISTHDMSLTEIADVPGLSGANVHMCAKDGDDPMSFDYRLKPGITTEANALAIARLAGVPV